MRFNPAKILPKTLILLVLAFVFQTDQLSAQHEEQATASHQAAESHQGTEGEWKIQDMIFEHINNSNEFHIFGHVAIPLPVIVWSKEDGLTTFIRDGEDSEANWNTVTRLITAMCWMQES